MAVKIAATSSDPEKARRARDRFAREARLAAKLRDNTHVVVVHDWGNDSGIDYLVMELLEGCNLSEWRRANPRAPLSLRLSIVRQAALGLAAGHAAGIIHRDVKPSNLFILPNGGSDVRVKVVDFGIAKPMAPVLTKDDLTQDGAFVGTLLYAAPEQLRGDRKPTPAYDVFSLGVIAYELITGRHPFTQEDRVRLLNRSPVHVPSPQRLVPELPDSVAEFVSRALSVAPGDRPRDTNELAEAVAAAHNPSAYEPLQVYHSLPPLRKRLPALYRRVGNFWLSLGVVSRRTVAAATVAAAAGAIGAVALPSPSTDAEAVTEFTPAVVTANARVAAREANNAGLASLENGDTVAATGHFRTAVQLNPHHQEYPDNLAFALRKQGHFPEAVAVLENVVRRWPKRVSAHYNLAEAYVGVHDTTSAIPHLRQYIQMAEPQRAAKGHARMRELQPDRS